MSKSRWAMFISILLVGLPVSGFTVPIVCFPDRAPELTDHARVVLKSQASIGYKVRPAHAQIVAARITGPTPHHVEGDVAWRTLFGVPAGTDRVTTRDMTFNMDYGRILTAWAMLALVEAALLALLVRLILVLP
jgi:hypothetical protein